MAQTTNATNATLNVVENTTNATATKAATRRVVETRDMWAVVFNHTATLLATAINGEAVTGDDVAGFAFGKRETADGKTQKLTKSDQPNIRGYLYSLLAAFGSKKGIKHSKGTALEALNLEEVAQSVAFGLWPKFDWEKHVGKAEPKQAKSLVEAVLAKLN